MSFLSLDGTLFVQLINFVIFFAVLNVVFLRPVAAAISKRRAYINGLVSDYDRYQAEADSLRAEAESVRNAARREAQHQIAAARAAASNETAEISSRYARDAQGIVDEADRTVRAELDAARAGEGDAVRRIADVMLERAVPEATA
jgi:F-type H+-transporting ATPase subunit b